MQADAEQSLIDAEVRITRHRLLQDLRRSGGTKSVAFLDDDFLAIADQPTVVAAIFDAALTAGAADSCDLQFYDPSRRACGWRRAAA